MRPVSAPASTPTSPAQQATAPPTWCSSHRLRPPPSCPLSTRPLAPVDTREVAEDTAAEDTEPEDTEVPATEVPVTVDTTVAELAATVLGPAGTVELAVLEVMVSAEASEASVVEPEDSVVEPEDSVADPCLFRASRFTTPEVPAAATEAPVATAGPELTAVLEATVLEATAVLEATEAQEATVGQEPTEEPADSVALEAIPSTAVAPAVAPAAAPAGSGKVKLSVSARNLVCVCVCVEVCVSVNVSPFPPVCLSLCASNWGQSFRRARLRDPPSLGVYTDVVWSYLLCAVFRK